MDEQIAVMYCEPGKEFRYYRFEDRSELEALVASGAYKIVAPFPKFDPNMVAIVEASESGPYCFSTEAMDLFGFVYLCNRLNGKLCGLTNLQFTGLYGSSYPVTVRTAKTDAKRITEKCFKLLCKGVKSVSCERMSAPKHVQLRFDM